MICCCWPGAMPAAKPPNWKCWIRAFVRDAAEQATAMGGTKNVRVELKLDGNELPIRVSEAKLRRLL